MNDIGSAEQYLVDKLPWSLQATGSMDGGTADIHARMFAYKATSYASSITVLVTFAQVGPALAERIDAQALYWPPCPDIAALIPNPSGAVVTVMRSSKATIQRHIDRLKALGIVAVLETLPPVIPGRYNCAMDTGRDNDIVAFSTPQGPRVVRVDLTGCLGITFDQRPGIALLDTAGRLNTEILKVIRLPAEAIR